ncbi:nitroreductase family protein [Desulfopila aestuarii]|uniref:Nitroreductase n=1 Tax=Desulfopila aestuarii DSM 18488 TaxID=1121416 RepID=A0A1M7Y183_9BACT|nr:nitroreductase family protein [Desulfopila aestuarii]SHO45459.1 Nitroreductase [Desulfopila aestuarii DSM 18488]
MHTDLLQVVKERRSVREFTNEPVSQIDIMNILEAGCWAPSVRNNQPWKFVVISDPGMRAILSEHSIYSTIISQCPVVIAVYLEDDKGTSSAMGNQAIGAAIQNMLLVAEDIGLGGVWLGDIQDCRDKINIELGIAEKYNLAAMLAIGYPAHRNQKSHRKHVNDFILKNIGG